MLQIRERALFHWRRLTDPLAPRHAKPYATHVPALIGLAYIIPVRTVVEFGAGLVSTPAFLDPVSFPLVRRLTSYETDGEWYDTIRRVVGGDERAKIVSVGGPM